METNKSEVAQQPTYDTSYPSGLTVQWNQNGKTVLATVLEPADNNEDDLCKIRVLNSTIEHSVPISTLFPVITPCLLYTSDAADELDGVDL
eukprot:1183508-Ditylum_brightwellii.AAC.1